jgi:membrane protease YdiL (CAAX protease family)/Fe-S-cluster-containing hydrogenase component 2
VSTGAHLMLRPNLCDQCGACVAACPSDAVRVGQDYILIDWHACNQCCECVDVCRPHAIQREVVPVRSTSASPVAPADVTKVLVGSRAEAKAVRKAAEQAAKQAAKAASHPTAPRTAGAPSTVAAKPTFAMRRSAKARPVPAPERELPSSRVRWTVVDGAAVLAVLLLTIVGKNAVLGIHALGLMPASGRAFTRAAVLAVYYSVQIAAFVFLAGRHGSSLLRGFGLTRDPESGEAGVGLLAVLTSAGLSAALFVGVEAVALGYGLAVQAAGWKQPLSLSSDVASVFGAGTPGLALSALLVVLVAPVAEELAFRGVILDSVGERWGMWPAIAISALLFAGYHLNLWLFFPMLVLGGALGWLAWTRRSLWPAIVVHIAYNGLAVAAAFLVPK